MGGKREGGREEGRGGERRDRESSCHGYDIWHLRRICHVNIYAPSDFNYSLTMQYVTRYSRKSLRVLGSVGEPINPSAWRLHTLLLLLVHML